MWGMGGWTGSDDAESLRSLHRAVELGCTFFDTAWAYGQGHSERLLGELVRAHPESRAGRRLQGAAEEHEVAGQGRVRAPPTSTRPITSGSTPKRAWATWSSSGST